MQTHTHKEREGGEIKSWEVKLIIDIIITYYQNYITLPSVNFLCKSLMITSAPIGAWKCNFLPLKNYDRPTYGQGAGVFGIKSIINA